MHNIVDLIGRLEDNVEMTTNKNGVLITNIKIIVTRAYKNENGEYESDILPIMLFNGVAQNTTEYCHKGDLIGIKGRIQNIDNKMTIIGDKVSFLTSSRE